jgi:hypothetical protein
MLDVDAVGAGPAIARRSRRTFTPGLTSTVAIPSSSAVILPRKPDVVVTSSPTARLACML